MGIWADLVCMHFFNGILHLARWKWTLIGYDKCSCAAVQNEVHVLNHCQDLSQSPIVTIAVLSREEVFVPFFPFCQSFSMKSLYILLALLS